MYVSQAARACGMEVMYTVTQSLTADGRDRSLEHKISGYHVPPGCWDAEVSYMHSRMHGDDTYRMLLHT